MGPPEESVEIQHSYCPNDDKIWCKYHKDKIFNTNIYDRCVSTTKIKYLTQIYMIDQNVYHLCFVASFMSTWSHSKSERVH